MKKTTVAAITAAVGISVVLSCAGCGGVSLKSLKDPLLEISADFNDRTEISSELFGVFLEDINYTSQAMDDNLIANGSFEAKTFSTGWNRGTTTLTQMTEGGISEGAPNYAEVETAAGGSLTNAGFVNVPIAVTEGTKYEFSAFIRADDYAGKVEIKVKDTEKEYLAGSIDVKKSSEWVKYVATLTASATAMEDLKFELDFASRGTLSLDGVQLVTSDATAGVKNYVYDAIAGLSPKFVRFPGGCIIEGKDDYQVYDWKNSIGAVAKNGDDEVPTLTYTEVRDGVEKEGVTSRGEEVTRKPNGDLWAGSTYYDMEYGVGFYEYFLMCEALKASPIPILNCGLDCMIQARPAGAQLNGRHGGKIQDFIQDAKDLVAFANGSVSSNNADEKYWAQVRTDMGHPEPFHLKYLGIGNEQWGNSYFSAYEQFLAAFKTDANAALYKDIQLIVGNGPNFIDCQSSTRSGTAQRAAQSYLRSGNAKVSNIREYGIQDHHYYMNYTDFLWNYDFYDVYSRDETGYDVFLGEYSANSDTSQDGTKFYFEHNNWITALSEAAYMTGLERNGDVVKLAAYAPMFGVCKEGSPADGVNQWAANMMYFTNTEMLLTPNYYVQQLFAQNTGSAALATEVTGGSGDEFFTIEAANGGPGVEVNKAYYVVSYDEAKNELIVKVVNACPEEVKLNFTVENVKLQSKGKAIMLQCDDETAVNTLGDYKVSPQEFDVSGAGQKFGYAAPAHSVTVLRIPVSK